MSIGIFTDKTRQPDNEELLTQLGSRVNLWESLTQRLEEVFRPKSEFKFYGKNYGWALRFRKGGKALASLYPGKEGFTVQVVLGENHIEHALGVGLAEKTCRIIQDATPFPEGRWLFLRIEDETDLEDIWHLLAVKMGKR